MTDTTPNLFLLYTLKEGVTPEQFETWVRKTDYPSMRGLARVADFRTYRAERLLIGEADMTRKRRGQVVDKMAAAYILQGALDSLDFGIAT